MSNTEQLIILGAVAWVSYLVGQAKANKAAGPCKCQDSGASGSAGQADAPSSMDWFANWGGLK